ncbi:30S ribosomal protein S20 [soil metagenome]
MAHSLSAKKRIRQNIKAKARNRARKEGIKLQTKSFLAALATGDAAKAETELRKTVQKLDRTAAKHTIHKNAAARKRSRLTLRLNALKSGTVKAVVAKGSVKQKVAKTKGAGKKAAKA